VSDPPRILLVGMMGAGKSTVGRLLAERLGWGFSDSDAVVEAATGRSVPELFSARGEALFRLAESEALKEIVSGSSPVVVSVAVGAVLDPVNRTLLVSSGTVVWLRATVSTLADRVGDGSGRPLLGDDPVGALNRLDAERRPAYDEVASWVVEVDGLEASEVADRVLECVGLVA
jgi:shikimate kinase